MNLKVIACKIMQRELSKLAWDCPNMLDFTTLRQRYHSVPVRLHDLLQEEIDRIEEGEDPYTNGELEFDAILIGYGLCSNALLGLHSKKYPLVVPRAHDCTTLFMGGKEKYQEYFDTYKGAYFYNRDWMELGQGMDEQFMARKYNEYKAQFEDEDTVEYLMDMERQMLANYKYAIYITWPDFPDGGYKEEVKELARQKDWDYIEVEGSDSLLKKMLDGDWNEEDFLIVKPGYKLEADTGTGIIKAVPAE